MTADPLPAWDFPARDDQVPARLLSVLGGFWADVYDGRPQVEHLARAAGGLAEAAYDRLAEAAQAVARERVPLAHVPPWHAWTLRAGEADRLRYRDSALDFDGRAAYGDAEGLVWPAPEGLTEAPVLTDRLGRPGLVWTGGLDYQLERRGERAVVRFAEDPFGRPEFARVTDADGVEELTLWLFKPRFDRRLVARHWGYLVPWTAPSSAGYRDALNAFLDALRGTSRADVERLLAAAWGAPLAGGAETVEAVFGWNSLRWVVTDAAAYPYGAAAEPAVAPGDAVTAGQPLTDALRLAELAGGVAPAWLDAVALGPGELALPLWGELLFSAGAAAWEGEADGDGRLAARFAVDGFPGDADAFWADVHRRGLEAGRTLAERLDRRPEGGREGATELLHLPAEVDPVGFLASQVLRGPTVVARVRAGACRPPAGLGGVGAALARVVPPGALLLVTVEAPGLAGTAAGGESTITALDAPEPTAEAAGGGPAGAQARSVGRKC